MFYSDPSRAVIVKSNQSSKLQVTYDNRPIAADVTLAQVDLWNAGTLSIEHDDILKPGITISTFPRTPILEPRVLVATRLDIINPQLDTSHTSEGHFGISWDRLEKTDAIKLQVIFTGTTDTKLAITGALKDQPRISALSIEPHPWVLNVLLGSLACLGILVLLFFLSKRYPNIDRPKWAEPALQILIIVCILCIITTAAWGLISRLTQPRLMPENLMPPTVQQQFRQFNVVSPFTNR